MPTYSFPTNIAVGDLGQVTWANGVSAALNELGTLVDTKAADSSVVKLTGNQTVDGTKTFSSSPSVPDSSFSIAKTTGLQTALDLKSPLASPTFTGTPSAPTPTTSDSTTKLATTAFVKAQGYATLASPTLTGDPKAPTPATADNDTSIATTAFVKAQGYATTTALADKLDTIAAPELIRDTMGTALVAGSNVTITPNDAGDTITIASSGGGGGGTNIAPAGFKVPLIRGSGIVSLQAGWINSVMIYIPQAITISEISINVTTSGTSPSNVHLGIYSITSPGGTGTLVHNLGSVDTTTTGIKTLTGSWAVPVGSYYLSYLMAGSGCVVTAGGNLDGIARMIIIPGEYESGRRYLSNNGASSLPASITSVAANGGSGSSGVALPLVVLS